MLVKKLDNINFYDTLKQEGKIIIIDFYADWCMPCKMIAPILEEIAAENADTVEVYKLNVEEQPEIASKFSVMNIPTIISFKNGELYKKQIGAGSKERFLELIN